MSQPSSPLRHPAPIQLQMSEDHCKPVSPRPGEVPARLLELYNHHAQRLQQLKLQREKDEREEIQKIADERKGARQGTRKAWKPGQERPSAVGRRLYSNHATLLEHLQALQDKTVDAEHKKLQEARDHARPTRKGVDMKHASCAAASVRLYSDAQRRERDRIHREQSDDSDAMTPRTTSSVSSYRHEALYGDAQDRQRRLDRRRDEALEEEMHSCVQFKASPRHGASESEGCQRFEALYQHAAERQKRMEQERQAMEDAELKEMNSVKPRRKGGHDQERIEALHREYADRQRRLAFELANKRIEEERLAAHRTQMRSRSSEAPSPRPLSTSPSASPPASGMPQAECLLEAVITGIQTRCGYAGFRPQDSEKRAMLGPLRAAMMKYKEASLLCEKSDGFSALLCRASQRLFFGGYLVPEFEGVSRCVQPDPTRQVEENLESLLASAQQAQTLLKERIAPGAHWATGAIRPHPQGVPLAMFAIDPGVKTESAARTKALVQFAPSEGSKSYRHLVDLARIGLVFSNCDMLQAGLEHILRSFPEVVLTRNGFSSPGRLGNRWIEMLVVVPLVNETEQTIPHVCELRLEELSMHRARMQAEEDLETFFSAVRRTYDRASRELDAVVYMAHTVISKPSSHQSLRTFRCNLARRCGSTICGWRRCLAGSGRHLNFHRFRDACQSLKCRQCVTELWQELDPGLSGNISLFEIDPDAVSLLIRLRSRIVALLRDSQQHDPDADALFARLTFHIRPARPGQLDAHEFRVVMKPLGFTVEDADKAFSFLDYHGGSNHAPPATVNKRDLLWLKRLPELVNVNAITLSSANKPSEEDYFRNVIQSSQSARRARRVLRRASSLCADSAGCTSGDDTDTSEKRPQEPFAWQDDIYTSEPIPQEPVAWFGRQLPQEPAAWTSEPLPQETISTEAEKEFAAVKIQHAYRGRLYRARILDKACIKDHKNEDVLSTECPANAVNDTSTACNESSESHELPILHHATFSFSEQQTAVSDTTITSSNDECQTAGPERKHLQSNDDSEWPQVPDMQVPEPKWQEVFNEEDTF